MFGPDTAASCSAVVTMGVMECKTFVRVCQVIVMYTCSHFYNLLLHDHENVYEHDDEVRASAGTGIRKTPRSLSCIVRELMFDSKLIVTRLWLNIEMYRACQKKRPMKKYNYKKYFSQILIIKYTWIS